MSEIVITFAGHPWQCGGGAYQGGDQGEGGGSVIHIYTRYYTLCYPGAGPRDGSSEAHPEGAADPGARLRAGHAAATRHQAEARRHQGGRQPVLIT